MKITRVDRFLTKYLGFNQLRHIPKDCPYPKPEGLWLGIFHFCKNCQEFRFDAHFEQVSHSSRFSCEGCKKTVLTPYIGGFNFFQIMEAARVTEEKGILGYVLFLKRVFLGLGSKLPDDQEGENSEDLESKAIMTYMHITLYGDDFPDL